MAAIEASKAEGVTDDVVCESTLDVDLDADRAAGGRARRRTARQAASR